MKVWELIACLKNFDKNLEVVLFDRKQDEQLNRLCRIEIIQATKTITRQEEGYIRIPGSMQDVLLVDRSR